METKLKLSGELSHTECATVLAALRVFQEILPVDCDRESRQYRRSDLVHMEHFEDGTKPLTPKQIDALCERINLEPTPTQPDSMADKNAASIIEAILIEASVDNFTRPIKLSATDREALVFACSALRGIKRRK